MSYTAEDRAFDAQWEDLTDRARGAEQEEARLDEIAAMHRQTCLVCHGTGHVLVEIGDGGMWYDPCPVLEDEAIASSRRRR
ncbi:hypothetical protein GCM10009785_19840 [Brooklawnia cerclae]|uniref:Mono/diheme cytochrome c family protein n=1 Tax=Brooklawnia cerclae TaxID=349934 RepID=A0ABX0SFV6_9ACTN|nr:hypothetical protein [Brooklawnia cerclae]NIH57275.1 mono/diheme cytochrome c family protein [Brooklawnia cerclae]